MVPSSEGTKEWVRGPPRTPTAGHPCPAAPLSRQETTLTIQLLALSRRDPSSQVQEVDLDLRGEEQDEHWPLDAGSPPMLKNQGSPSRGPTGAEGTWLHELLD